MLQVNAGKIERNLHKNFFIALSQEKIFIHRSRKLLARRCKFRSHYRRRARKFVLPSAGGAKIKFLLTKLLNLRAGLCEELWAHLSQPKFQRANNFPRGSGVRALRVEELFSWHVTWCVCLCGAIKPLQTVRQQPESKIRWWLEEQPPPALHGTFFAPRT